MVILRESFGEEVWRAAPAPDLIQSPEFFAAWGSASGRRFLSCKLYMPQRLLRKHVNARSRIRLKNQRGAEAMPYVVSTTVMSGFSVGGPPARVASSLAP